MGKSKLSFLLLKGIRMSGIFITIEGPDGSGKSTQVELLQKYLKAKGKNIVITREPGGTRIGEMIRNIILDRENTEMDYVAEALLYAASRAQHVEQIIKPALLKGDVVICDRYVDSSIVYQGVGRGLGESVSIINEIAIKGCMPDITFLFKLDPSIGKGRIKAEDRLEMEKMEYHNKVYEGYLELEKRYPERIKGIDASREIHVIHEEIKKYIEELIIK